jgi:hypothetical protein
MCVLPDYYFSKEFMKKNDFLVVEGKNDFDVFVPGANLFLLSNPETKSVMLFAAPLMPFPATLAKLLKV